jgi:cyclopropane-fatty-acyl-phospholipid synthase
VTRRHTDLRLTGTHAFGPHYAETLRRWRQVFLESWPAVATLGFDETFRRMWEFYLAYSEAGFASGYLDVAQLTLARDGD